MKKINQIKYLPDKLVFPRPNFSEELGSIDKTCKFWLEYFDHKATAIDKGTNEGINTSEADEIEEYSNQSERIKKQNKKNNDDTQYVQRFIM